MVKVLRRLFEGSHKSRVVRVPQTSQKELIRINLEKFTEGTVKHPSPPLFVAASVELGNTTTKCIITSTNMLDGKIYLLSKVVRLTKHIRNPLPGEKIFGMTVWEKKLTLNAVKEFVSNILTEALTNADIDRDAGLHFAARSTGVTASFSSPEEVGAVIRALAEGCISAGISPSKMVAPLSVDQVPEELREYSKLNLVPFDGSVAGCLPPRTPSEVIANEMEAELSTAGIKLGAKWINFDFRNPVLTLDFGTTLKGRVTDNAIPYANTIGSISGLAGAIADAMVQGAGIVDPAKGSALEACPKDIVPKNVYWDVVEQTAEEAHRYLRITKIPPSRLRFGTVPVNPSAAERAGICLMGCDIGEDGSDIPGLRRLGAEIHRDYGLHTLFAVLDVVMAKTAFRIVELAFGEGLIDKRVSIGITGRAGITGKKPEVFLNYVGNSGLYGNDSVSEHLIFVEDGLALGASMMGRCMFGLGVPKYPLGGNRGDACVLTERLKYLNRATHSQPSQS